MSGGEKHPDENKDRARASDPCFPVFSIERFKAENR